MSQRPSTRRAEKEREKTCLIVGQMDVFHGQQRQFIRPVRISAMFHVASDGEELHGRHDVRGGIDDNLIGSFEADGRALAQVEGVERTVGRILKGTNVTSISYSFRV